MLCGVRAFLSAGRLLWARGSSRQQEARVPTWMSRAQQPLNMTSLMPFTTMTISTALPDSTQVLHFTVNVSGSTLLDTAAGELRGAQY